MDTTPTIEPAPGNGAPAPEAPPGDIGGPAPAEARRIEYDQQIVALANEWDTTVAHYRLLVGGGEYETYQEQIAAIEGKLLRLEPKTILGVQRMLLIAHRIAGNRESNDDRWLGEGPAAGLIACAVRRLDEIG